MTVQGKLLADGVWRGTVILADDFLVPRGRTLRILAGTRILVRPADTTKTEPEYLDNATELLVRGRLSVEGTAALPVIFEPLPVEAGGEGDNRWGGIIFDGGEGEIRHGRLSGAETGLTLLGSSPSISDLVISGVRQGIAVQRGSAPRLLRVTVAAEDGGVACWPGSSPVLEALEVRAGEHEGLLVAPGAAPRITWSFFKGKFADVLWGASGDPPPELFRARVIRVRDFALRPGPPDDPHALLSLPPPLPFEPKVPPPGATPTRVYRGEQFIGEDTTWEGEVLIDGTVMIAPVARLTIAPGTVVRFGFRDTDADGVGESELFIQGRLLAEGTRTAPIVFTALDGEGRGRWGAINLMGTDAEESRLAWCLVESGFRGLHSHFSRFRAEHSIFRNNFRAIQFQESTAAITDCAVSGSASALRFRDSTAAIERLSVFGNTLGIQVLRSSFSLVGSSIVGNSLAGMHVRESEGTIAGNRFEANSPGLRVSDCRARIEGNRFLANNAAGLQLRRTQGRVEGNRIEASVGNGVSTDSPGAVLRGNAIVGSLRFALESNSGAAIDAVGNWWGPDGPRAEGIFDVEDEAGLGPVLTAPPLVAPPVL
ncbi:MAG: right-handed parallel beta-helix repeat-containing protein [Candidatus Methylomirabilia bacterium]